MTAAEMGDACGLSAAAALKRFKRLQKSGAIVGDSIQIDPKKFGLNVQMLVLVTLERERKEEIAAFKSAIKTEPRIVQGYSITGDADFITLIAAKDMQDYESFTQTFFYDLHRVKSFKTLVVLDDIKTGARYPVFMPEDETFLSS